MGGQAINDAKRDQYFWIDPKRAIVDGYDNDAGPESPYWVEDCKLVPDQAFIDDLIVNGVLQPVKVRKEGSGVDAPLHVTKGRKRTKGLRLANRALAKAGRPPLQLPVIIDKIDDKQVLLQALSENLQRFDTSPVDRAKMVQRLTSLHQVPIADIAVSMGESVQTAKGRLRWFDLDRKLQKAHEAGQVAFTAVVEFAELEREDQRLKLDEMLAEGGAITVGRVRRAKHEAKVAKGRKSKSTTPYPQLTTSKLRKIAEHGDGYGIPKAAVSMAKAAVGINAGANIPGLSALLRDIRDGKL